MRTASFRLTPLISLSFYIYVRPKWTSKIYAWSAVLFVSTTLRCSGLWMRPSAS